MGIKTINSCKLIKPVTVKESDSIIEVAKKIHDFQERRIFVVNKKNSPVGIISLVDINDRVVAKGKNLKKTKAKDVMSFPLKIVLDIQEPVEEAAKKMILNDNYYCPVVSKGILKGLVTYSSILQCYKYGKR